MDEDRCRDCNVTTSQYWSGFLCVIDPEKSEIAIRMGIKKPGNYAMTVR